MRLFPILALLLLGSFVAEAAEPVKSLPRAHSHNDYLRKQPLQDALDNGFCGIEADIFLVAGELLVAHDAKDLTPERSLRALYLDPLKARVEAHGGRVYPGGPTITLLIDIKDEAEVTYAALRTVLQDYAPMLTRFTPDSTTEGAVTVILSGNRPEATMAAEAERLAALDGRIPDLDRAISPHLYPLISDNWKSHFTWTGKEAMPAEERARLDALVAKTHAKGMRLRFWGLPFPERVWPTLYDAGVDLLNADQLPKLRALLEARAAGATP
jgi:hypothetical protein